MLKLIIAALLLIIFGFGVSTLHRAGFFNTDNTSTKSEEVSEGNGTSITGPSVSPGEPVTSIVGRILSITGNTITVTAESPLGLSDDPELRERSVTLTEATVVSAFAPKDPELVKKEMDELRVRIAENERLEAEARAAGANIPVTPPVEIPTVVPTVYEKRTTDAGVLSVGQVVNIGAAVDIRTERNFTAISIDVLYFPPTP